MVVRLHGLHEMYGVVCRLKRARRNGVRPCTPTAHAGPKRPVLPCPPLLFSSTFLPDIMDLPPCTADHDDVDAGPLPCPIPP